MENFYNWCPTPFRLIHKKYQKIYLNLITEWNKTLFTPYPLLHKIILDFNHFVHCGSLVYDYVQIKSLLTKENYSFYQKFFNIFNNLTDKKNFKIIVVYLDNKNKEQYDFCLKYIQNKQSIDYYFEIFNQQNIPAKIFKNKNYPQSGCIIFLNNNIIDNHNQQEMQFQLDHQLNHYFDLLKEEQIDQEQKSLTLTKKLKKIAYDAGYDLSNQQVYDDFVQHVLSNEQFIQMVCDMNNTIQLYFKSDDKYYDWLRLINSSFIQSNEFKKLDYHIQNSIIFCYFIKTLSKTKWQKIKQSIQIELNNPKKNFFKQIQNKLSQFLERFKVR